MTFEGTLYFSYIKKDNFDRSNAVIFKNEQYRFNNYAIVCKLLIDFNEAFFPTMSCSSLTDPALLRTHRQGRCTLRMD